MSRSIAYVLVEFERPRIGLPGPLEQRFAQIGAPGLVDIVGGVEPDQPLFAARVRFVLLFQQEERDGALRRVISEEIFLKTSLMPNASVMEESRSASSTIFADISSTADPLRGLKIVVTPGGTSAIDVGVSCSSSTAVRCSLFLRLAAGGCPRVLRRDLRSAIANMRDTARRRPCCGPSAPHWSGHGFRPRKCWWSRSKLLLGPVLRLSTAP